MNENIYLGGWEIDFEDDEELRNFIIQHRLTKKDFDIFTAIQSGIEIRTENGKITEAIEQLGNEKISGPLELPIPDSKPHKLFWLKPSLSGQHQLGGKLSDSVNILTDDSFQPIYLGYLNCNDEHFSWIGLDKLHLFYQLDFYYEPCFIDYTNELQPELIKNATKTEYLPKSYLSPMNVETTRNVTIQEISNESDPIHQCGVPLWYQYPEYPKCPKTGELMKFVCSISSNRKIKWIKNEQIENNKTEEFLMFGDMGNLFVFFHPESKILYLTTQ